MNEERTQSTLKSFYDKKKKETFKSFDSFTKTKSRKRNIERDFPIRVSYNSIYSSLNNKKNTTLVYEKNSIFS